MLSVSIVIPTRNESTNIENILSQIIPYGHEVIIVDDSDDNTAAKSKACGARVVVGQRKGLGQAIIDGINASISKVVVVMDGDGSHSPQALPAILKPILEQGCDLVIGSRYVKLGSTGNWNQKRKWQSIIGSKLMQLVTGVKDSNSGFFAFRKSILDGVELKPRSWKIMLEVLFKGKWISKQEVPIVFNDRQGGVSKNSNSERVKHAKHLLTLLIEKFKRYITFACVGGIGALWYFGILYFLTEHLYIWYGLSAILATGVAITNNYLINHFYTFRKEKTHNKNLFKGWLKYVGNSAVGDGVDWCVMVLLTEVFGVWYMLSAFLASGVASVIKYVMASNLIWNKKGKSFMDADYEWVSFYKGKPWQKLSKQYIARTVKKMAGNAGITVDIGCGSSPLGILTNHADYIGIDMNKDKMEYMSSKELKDTQFIEGSVLNIPLQDNYADTILFIETIEHLNTKLEINNALEEIKRVLKPDGKLIVAMPDFKSLPGKIMEKLYGIFHPSAYADDHKVKLDDIQLINMCWHKGLILQESRNLLKRDFVMSFIKDSKWIGVKD